MMIPALTFAQKVAPIEALCRRIIERHGGTPRAGRSLHSLTSGSVVRSGYVMPRPVAPSSEEDFALRILWTLRAATSATDLELGRKLAWDAAQLVLDAHMTFARKKSMWNLSLKASEANTTRALAESRANEWQQEVDTRRVGRSKGAVCAAIEGLEGLQPGTVKRALQRRRQRLCARNQAAKKKTA